MRPTRRLRVRGVVVKLSPMPRRGAARSTGTALAAVLLLLAAAGRAEEPPERVVRYDNDTLTVRLSKVPVGEVLDELSRASGAEIHGQPTGGDVSAEFESVPLTEALHRLLGEQNFALVYGDSGRLKAVKLLGGPQGPSSAAAAPAFGAPPAANAPTDPAMVLRLFASQSPVPVTGRLAQALGSETATFQQLMDAGMHNDDAGVRAEAVRAGIQNIEKDANLRSAVLNTVNSMDDSQLGQIVRGMAGDRAEEFMMHIATQSRASEMRIKASSVLQQLRTSGRAGG